MVANAREVYALMVTHQLEDPESEGLDFKLLFRCVAKGRMFAVRYLMLPLILMAALTELVN